MEPVRVMAVIPVNQDQVDLARTLLAQMQKDSRSEVGNEHFDISESASALGTFVVLERWASQSAFDTHVQSPKLATVMGQLAPLLVGPLDVHPLVALS